MIGVVSKPPAATERRDGAPSAAFSIRRIPHRPAGSTADDESDPEDPISPPRFP